MNSDAPEDKKKEQSEAVKLNKDKQYNDQRKRDKKTKNDVQNTTQKTKD